MHDYMYMYTQAQAIRENVEVVELEKITAIRILRESSANKSRFSRSPAGIFHQAHLRPLFPRFLYPFFIILARTMQQLTGSSKRSVMRKGEREKETKRGKQARKRKRRAQKIFSFPRSVSNAILATYCEVCNHTFNSQSRNVTQSDARTRETSRSSYTKRKPNAAKHDELMN